MRYIFTAFFLITANCSYAQFHLGNSKLNIGLGLSEFVYAVNFVPSGYSFEEWSNFGHKWELQPSLNMTYRGENVGLELGVARGIRFNAAHNTYHGKLFLSGSIGDKSKIDFGLAYNRYWGYLNFTTGTIARQNGFGPFLQMNFSYFSLSGGPHLFSRAGLENGSPFHYAINSWNLRFMVNLSKVRE